MSGHSTFFDTAGLAALTEDFFGESSAYTPVTGDPVAGVWVVLTKDVELRPVGYNANVPTIAATIEALVSDVGDVTEGDTFTIGSTIWTCVSELDNNGAITRWGVK